MSSDAVLESLAASPIFAGLDAEAHEVLRDRARPVRLAAGEVLVEEGQVNDRLYLVVVGELEVTLRAAVGRPSPVKLNILKPGDCIGEYSFFDRQPVSADVRATGETALLSWDKVLFDLVADLYPTIGRTVYRNLLVSLVGRLRSKDAELDLFVGG